MIKILAIDDIKDNLIILKALVNEAFPDATLLMASDGKAGLKIAASENPDVILLDIVMPEMDGFEVCRRLKSDSQLKEIPVVFVTALKGDRESRIKALEVGAEAFLAKPIDETELTAQIRAMIKIKEANIKKRDEKAYLEALVAQRTKELNQELEEKRKTEELLTESEIKFRSIAEQLSDLIAITDQQGVIQYASPASETLFAVKPNIMAGMHFTHFLDETSIPSATAAFIDTIENKSGMITLELEMKRADGKRFFGEIKAMFYNYGVIPGTLITIRDVSERRKSEDLIRLNEKKFRSLFDNQIEAYALHQIILDDKGNPVDYRFLEVNQSFLKMTGKNDRSDVIGKTVLEIWPDTDQHWIQTYGKVALTQESITFENFSSPLKRHYIVSAYSTEKGVFGTSFIDITERKNAEMQILKSKEQFQQLIETLPISLAIVTTSGEVQYINPKCQKLFEVDTDFKPDSHHALIHWVNAEDRQRWLNEIQTKGFVQNFEMHVKTLSGKELWALGSGLFIQHKDQTCVLSTHHDITEIKLAQEAVRESEERFSKAFMTSPYMLTITRAKDGKMIEINDSFCSTSGYSREEVLQSSTIELKIWKNLSDREKLVEALLTGQSVNQREFTYCKKNGEEIIGLISSQMLYLNGEQCIVSSIEDITERKLAQIKITENELRLRTISENLPGFFYQIQYSNIQNVAFKYVSQGIELFGLTKEQVLNDANALFSLIHPDDFQRFLDQATDSRNFIENWHEQFRLLHPDGHILWIEVHDIPRKQVDGSYIYYGYAFDITDRKKAESQMNELKNRYQSLFENSLIGTGLAKLDGAIIDCNAAFGEMLGYTVDEMKALNVNKFYLDPSERKGIISILQKNESLIDYETRLIRKDNQLIDVLLNISVINFDGETYLQTTCLNITARKRAETALKESEHFSNAVTNATPALLYIYDLEQNKNIWTNDVHKAFFRDLTQDSSGLEYKDIGQIVHADDFERINKKTQHLVINSQSNHFDDEIRLRWNDTWKWFKINTRVFKRKMDGKPLQMLGAIFDIDDRKKAEDALKESESKFRTLFETANDAIFLMREDIFSDCNQKTLDMFGCSREQIIGQPPHIYSPEFQPDGSPSLQKSLEKINNAFGGKTEFFEWKHKRLDGSLFDAEVSLNAIEIKGEKFLQAIVRDITERKKSEELLMESEERFRALHNASFGGIVIHDKGKILACNKGLSEMTGYNMEELIGMDGLKLISDQVVDVVKEHINAAYEKSYESICRHKNETEFPIRIESRNIPYKGKMVRVTEFRDITEQKMYEKAIQEKEERWRTIIKTSPDGIVISTLEGAIQEVSDLAWQMFGYDSPEEILGKNILKFLDKSYQLKATQSIQQMMKGNYSGPAEYLVVKKDGSRFYVEINAEIIRDKDGKPVNLIFVERDITERKFADQRIKESEERFRLMVKNSSDIIVLVDEKAVQHYVSPAAEQITGYSPEELIDRPISEVIHPEDMPHVQKMWNDLLMTPDKLFSAQYRHIHKTKGWIYLEAFGQNLLNEPSVKSVVASVRDISLSKRSEQVKQIQYEIASSILTADQFQNLMEIIHTELGKVLDTTNFFVALYNQEANTLKKIIFKDEHDDYSEWDADQSLSGYVAKTGKALQLTSDEEPEFLRKHNIEPGGTPAECWLGVPLSVGNKVAGVMVIQSYTDKNAYDSDSVALLEMTAHEIGVFLERQQMIEDLIKAKDQAEAGDRLKTAFMNNISHEIRTPLGGILGFAPMLIDPDTTNEERKEYLQIMEVNSERLMNTVTDYMDISLLVSGNMKVKPSAVNVSKVMEDLYESLRKECSFKNLIPQLETGNLTQDFNFETDHELITKAIGHLLRNAVKFTDQGKITFGCRVQSRELVVYVKDTGIGISDEAKKRVFENFGQEVISVSRGHEGSGLGLSIAKGIVELLGGSISMVSEKNKGSEFYLHFPNSQVRPAINKTSEVTDDTLPKTKPLILIAEDEESNSMFLKILLKKSGCEVIHVINGQQAVEQCRIEPGIDLVFMDIKMPVMNGMEATEIIKSFRPELPIIAITAHALTGDEQRIRAAGCDDYIAKPVKMEVILSALKKRSLFTTST